MVNGASFRRPGRFAKLLELFENALPLVESRYRVMNDAAHRAIHRTEHGAAGTRSASAFRASIDSAPSVSREHAEVDFTSCTRLRSCSARALRRFRKGGGGQGRPRYG